MQTNLEDGQVSLFAQDTWSGKMSPEHSVPTKDSTLQQSLKRSSVSKTQKLPVCLCLRKDGLILDASTMFWDAGQLLGQYTMRSIGAYPREEREYRLSQILEDSPHPTYCLSARACQGILTRAARRGKALPEPLRIALEQTVAESQ